MMERTSSVRVLLAEREPDVRDQVRQLIERYLPGAQVYATSSFHDAIAHPRSPDILISCYRLDDGNGVFLLRAGRRKWPRAARMLICHLHEPRRAVEAVNEAGIQKLLMKPLDPKEFGAALEDLLQARQGRIPPSRMS